MKSYSDPCTRTHFLSRTGIRAFLAGVLLISAFSGSLHADGTETLGPVPFALAKGTRIVGEGVGMLSQPATITFDVPVGATVEQVLLYWNGFDSARTGMPSNSLILNGTTVVPGDLIGGPTLFFGSSHSYTYRADITGLGLIAPGTNSVVVSGKDFDEANNGASIVVVIDEGTTPAVMSIVDGQDLAFALFAPPLDTTVPQT